MSTPSGWRRLGVRRQPGFRTARQHAFCGPQGRTAAPRPSPEPVALQVLSTGCLQSNTIDGVQSCFGKLPGAPSEGDRAAAVAAAPPSWLPPSSHLVLGGARLSVALHAGQNAGLCQVVCQANEALAAMRSAAPVPGLPKSRRVPRTSASPYASSAADLEALNWPALPSCGQQSGGRRLTHFWAACGQGGGRQPFRT